MQTLVSVSLDTLVMNVKHSNAVRDAQVEALVKHRISALVYLAGLDQTAQYRPANNYTIAQVHIILILTNVDTTHLSLA